MKKPLLTLLLVTSLLVGCSPTFYTPAPSDTPTVTLPVWRIGTGPSIASLDQMKTVPPVLTASPSPRELEIKLYLAGTEINQYPTSTESPPTPTLTSTPTPLPTLQIAVVYHINGSTVVEYPEELRLEGSAFWCSSVGTSGNWVGIRIGNLPTVKKMCW